MSRAVLRMTLERYVESPAGDLLIEQDSHGKPRLNHRAATDIEFNVSHSGDWVLIGVSRGIPLGLDVERLRPVEDADVIARRFFAPSEARLVNRRMGSQKMDAFFDIWTCKEAYLKALGTGLAHPMSDFEVVLHGESSASIITRTTVRKSDVDFTIWRARPAPGYLAAVAVGARGVSVNAWRWTGSGGLCTWPCA